MAAKDVERRATPLADGEVVWSWRAYAGAKSARDESLAPVTVANKLVHRGEHGISRKPPRREGRADPACTCGQRALAQTSFARGPRVQRPPGLPCALVFNEGGTDAKLGRE